MKPLAMGETLLRDTDDLLESSPEVAEEQPAWQRYLEEEGKTGQDALDYIAGDGVDFAMATSVSGGYADSPEELYSALEEYSEEYYQNPRKRRLIPNGRASCVYLQGEKPKHWYQVDLFGRKEGHLRPNAPPKLMSPGAIYRSQKRVFAARQLLPSPFRMIAAMDLVDD